jgi:hypothetical protein
MRDDAQLVCPVAYVDPLNLWTEMLAPESVSVRLSSDPVPVRCLPATAPLFKDTGHCLRWFLAPYALLFVTDKRLVSLSKVETQFREWVAARIGERVRHWLVLFISDSDSEDSAAALQSIVNTLASDYTDRVLVIHR